MVTGWATDRVRILGQDDAGVVCGVERAEEDKEGWLSVLQNIRTRGATQVDLLVTDGHDGLLAAVGELFSATSRQRCLVHKQRNVLVDQVLSSDLFSLSACVYRKSLRTIRDGIAWMVKRGTRLSAA